MLAFLLLLSLGSVYRYFSRSNSTRPVKPCFTSLFSPLLHRAAHAQSPPPPPFPASNHSHTLSRALPCTLSHLPEPRTRTDVRAKLTPYTRLQSVCRSLLRKASDRMIIAFRSFSSFAPCVRVCSLSSTAFVRSSVQARHPYVHYLSPSRARAHF